MFEIMCIPFPELFLVRNKQHNKMWKDWRARVIVCCALLACTVWADETESFYGKSPQDFEQWQTRYNKVYADTTETEQRFAIWQQSIDRINDRNEAHSTFRSA